MKKLLSVCLVLVMVMSFSVTALAKGGFVNSPSENLAPEIVGTTGGGRFAVHSYAERDKLTELQRQEIEDAYDSIKNADNLTSLNPDLEDIAKSKNIDPANLSVSDLFYVSYEGENPTETHTLTLKADTLNNFVALMAYVDGEWVIIDGAKIVNGNLVFDAKYFGPYAIVVNTNGAVKSPQTSDLATTESDSLGIAFYGIIMLVSACGAVVMWKKSKNHTA